MTDVDEGADVGGAVDALREFILAAEAFRAAAASAWQLGIRETEAISYLRSRGPMSQHRLGAALSLTPSAVSALVTRLEGRGLATREAVAGDRRTSLVTLTALAHSAAEHRLAALATCLRETPGGLEPHSTRLIRDLARQLRAHARLGRDEGQPS